MELATNSAVDTPVSAEVINAATEALRAVQSPMVQPVAVVVPAAKVNTPQFAYYDKLAIAVTQFVKGMAANYRAQDKLCLTAAALADQLVLAIHGDAKPDYAGYLKTQNEIKAASTLQYLQPMTLIKAYRSALVRSFGDLPISENAAAQAKAKARAKAKTDKASKGGKKGKPEVQPVAEHELIGQCIAKYGAAAVLVELSKILATEKATLADAHTLMDVAKHYAK